MSIAIERVLFCDGKNCNQDYSYSGGDQRHLSSKKIRYNAKCDGWTNKSNRDYCPECSKNR